MATLVSCSLRWQGRGSESALSKQWVSRVNLAAGFLRFHSKNLPHPFFQPPTESFSAVTKPGSKSCKLLLKGTEEEEEEEDAIQEVTAKDMQQMLLLTTTGSLKL